MKKTLTYGLTHLALAVKDVNLTKQFYEDVFSMKVMYFGKGFLQMTTPGNNDIIVFEEKEIVTGSTGDIAHFGFRLKNPGDIGEMIKRIIKAGGTITDQGEFVPGSPYVFFKDLDGYLVEAWYESMPAE
jgi:catechol 2,3-dioxygenase-like lactoylglutathione lyase family enzyme